MIDETKVQAINEMIEKIQNQVGEVVAAVEDVRKQIDDENPNRAEEKGRVLNKVIRDCGDAGIALRAASDDLRPIHGLIKLDEIAKEVKAKEVV